MALISNIDIALRADTNNLDKGLDKAVSKVANFSGSMEKTISASVGKSGASIGGMSSSMLGLAGVAGLAAGGIITAALAIGDGIKGTVDSIASMVQNAISSITSLGREAQRLGTSTGALGGLQHGAALAGIDPEAFSSGLQHLTRNVSEAAQGGGEAQQAFRQLGVDVQKLNNLSADKQLETLADALQGVKNQGDKAAISMKLFGREGGPHMLDMLGRVPRVYRKQEPNRSDWVTPCRKIKSPASRKFRLLGHGYKAPSRALAIRLPLLSHRS